jgi:hypothetical protein
MNGWVAAAMIVGGAALTVAGMIGMKQSTPAMRARGPGIVEFELAGSRRRTEAILRAWRRDGCDAAHDNILADVPFLLGYGMLLSALALAPADRLAAVTSSDAGTLSRWLAYAAVAAALLDMIEDVCLLEVLHRWRTRGEISKVSWVAAIAAAIKFPLVLAVIAWVVLFVWPALLAV